MQIREEQETPGKQRSVSFNGVIVIIIIVYYSVMRRYRTRVSKWVSQRWIFLLKTNISAQPLKRALHKTSEAQYLGTVIFLHEPPKK